MKIEPKSSRCFSDFFCHLPHKFLFVLKVYFFRMFLNLVQHLHVCSINTWFFCFSFQSLFIYYNSDTTLCDLAQVYSIDVVSEATGARWISFRRFREFDVLCLFPLLCLGHLAPANIMQLFKSIVYTFVDTLVYVDLNSTAWSCHRFPLSLWRPPAHKSFRCVFLRLYSRYQR
jgi:hypothetical protein